MRRTSTPSHNRQIVTLPPLSPKAILLESADTDTHVA
jgi:hypothetical protein